ncbi:MAG: hypothetical protein JWQ62_684 [Lacunisphaera sp.]|nr:hypothetical protein [Lacunisphaera sp.]
MNSLRQLVSYDVLLPLGVCLCFFGIIMRGLARSSQRDIALRRLHRLHHDKLENANQPDQQIGWFERHLPAIANTMAIGGLVIAVVALVRR